jgi:formate/nitrite transporter FocA (FNT family)
MHSFSPPRAQAAADYIVPALAGNILGGVALVAPVSHAQVIS